MHFMVNNNNKIIFGWSAKCGCSHVKKIFYFLMNGKIDNKIHTRKDQNTLPANLKEYKIILFIRNPYKRIISGFLDKYKNNGEFRNLWVGIPLTFTNFVDKVFIKDKMIQQHHFAPQTTESFNSRIENHSGLILYDIENIDYSYIETLFKTKIPEELIKFRGGHENKSVVVIDYQVEDMLMEKYCMYKPLTRCFYNDKIKEKVDKFYENDFKFFKKHGFEYNI